MIGVIGRKPVLRKNGECLMLSFVALFMANSTMLSILSHSLGVLALCALNTCSTVLFMRSVCPSDCGLNAVVLL